jgi:hypothetical protein
MVDTAKQAQARVKETKDRVTASVQSTINDTSASEALKYLRSVAKSYVCPCLLLVAYMLTLACDRW